MRWSFSVGPSSWITYWCSFWRISSSALVRAESGVRWKSCQRVCWGMFTVGSPSSRWESPAAEATTLGQQLGGRIGLRCSRDTGLTEDHVGDVLERTGRRRLRLVDDDGHAAVDGLRHRDVGRDLERGLERQRLLDLAHVELHLGVGPVQHELDLVAGEREQVERLDPD